MSDKISTGGEIMAAIVKNDEDQRAEIAELHAENERLKSGQHTINIAGTSPETATTIVVPCGCVADLEAARQQIAELEREGSKSEMSELIRAVSYWQDRALDHAKAYDDALARLAAAHDVMRKEHFSYMHVYMDAPQHERSLMRCQHPMCLVLKKGNPAFDVATAGQVSQT